MAYSFYDAYGSILSADSSVVSGTAQRPIVNVGSFLTIFGTTISGNPSISGTVNIGNTPQASVHGYVGVTGNPSISGTVLIGGIPQASVHGYVGVVGNPSVSGTVLIGGIPQASVHGNVNVVGNPSVSGTILIGNVPQASVHGIVGVSGSVNIGSIIGGIYTNPANYVWGTTSVITGTTAVSVLAAPGASLRNYITTIKVTNAAASGAIVDIKDSGADVLDTGYAAASGGGWSTTFTVPLKQVATNASIDAVPRSQASIFVAIVGYKGA